MRKNIHFYLSTHFVYRLLSINVQKHDIVDTKAIDYTCTTLKRIFRKKCPNYLVNVVKFSDNVGA